MIQASADITSIPSEEDRAQADLTSLLGELNRLLKTHSLYGATPGQRRAQAERTFLAWQADLERHGPLTLELDARSFTAGELRVPIELGRLQNLASALKQHEIDQVAFAPPLQREAFGTLTELLAAGTSDAAEFDPAGRSWSLAMDGIEVPALFASRPDAVPTLPETLEAPADQQASGTSKDEKPTVDERPLQGSTGSHGAESLMAWLLQLDDCEEDDAYADILHAIAPATVKLSNQEFHEEAYRVCLVLADHAVGEGGRSGTQAKCAQDALLAIATEGALPDLIARACDTRGVQAVRAACVLLQLGDAAATAVFDALPKETDSARASQLSGLMIALGESARSVLESNMKRPGGTRARAAIRLAGEIQSAAFVPALAAVLSGGDPGMRKDAAMALLMIGGSAAINPLVVALSSRLDKLSETAAFCLGELRDVRATAPLLRALESHIAAGRLEAARELVRALGRIGAEEAVPRFEAILSQRGLTKRRARRELKFAAIAALVRIPGAEAKALLRSAAANAEAPVRDKAKQSLPPLPAADATH